MLSFEAVQAREREFAVEPVTLKPPGVLGADVSGPVGHRLVTATAVRGGDTFPAASCATIPTVYEELHASPTKWNVVAVVLPLSSPPR
jgi:hypothetical protein